MGQAQSEFAVGQVFHFQEYADSPIVTRVISNIEGNLIFYRKGLEGTPEYHKVAQISVNGLRSAIEKYGVEGER